MTGGIRLKHAFPLALLPLLACIGFYAASDGKAPTTAPATSEEGLTVYLSPKGGCTEAVVDVLARPRSCR